MVYTTADIDGCGACGQAVLEHYSHDCWSYDEDHEMYWWYVLSAADTLALRAELHGCSSPLDSSCECVIHRSLRQSDEQLYGGIQHRLGPTEKPPYARVKLSSQKNAPIFELVV